MLSLRAPSASSISVRLPVWACRPAPASSLSAGLRIMAERRLCDAQMRGGAVETAALRDGEKGFETEKIETHGLNSCIKLDNCPFLLI
jgi:hypothetical protein